MFLHFLHFTICPSKNQKKNCLTVICHNCHTSKPLHTPSSCEAKYLRFF